MLYFILSGSVESVNLTSMRESIASTIGIPFSDILELDVLSGSFVLKVKLRRADVTNRIVRDFKSTGNPRSLDGHAVLGLTNEFTPELLQSRETPTPSSQSELTAAPSAAGSITAAPSAAGSITIEFDANIEDFTPELVYSCQVQLAKNVGIEPQDIVVEIKAGSVVVAFTIMTRRDYGRTNMELRADLLSSFQSGSMTELLPGLVVANAIETEARAGLVWSEWRSLHSPRDSAALGDEELLFEHTDRGACGANAKHATRNGGSGATVHSH
jgi:hypothetical protein